MLPKWKFVSPLILIHNPCVILRKEEEIRLNPPLPILIPSVASHWIPGQLTGRRDVEGRPENKSPIPSLSLPARGLRTQEAAGKGCSGFAMTTRACNFLLWESIYPLGGGSWAAEQPSPPSPPHPGSRGMAKSMSSASDLTSHVLPHLQNCDR